MPKTVFSLAIYSAYRLAYWSKESCTWVPWANQASSFKTQAEAEDYIALMGWKNSTLAEHNHAYACFISE